MLLWLSVAVIALLLLWAAWWWFVARNLPVVPPLNIAKDDPLILEAVAKARASISEMRRHFAAAPEYVRVKVPFHTNGGETEFLWAELLAIEGSEMEVRYMTPPVTHTGKLERVHRHPVSELQDWLFTKDEDNYRGGFSMRVMFIRGREAWGDLPPELKAQERKYGKAGT
jgi:uncharacterized protein YegJ (DUF2314 family)